MPNVTKSLEDIATQLRKLGFDAIPVSQDKSPLVKTYGVDVATGWSSRASGVALVTNTSSLGECVLMTIDIDVYNDQYLKRELHSIIDEELMSIDKEAVVISTASGGLTIPLWIPKDAAHASEPWVSIEGNVVVETRGGKKPAYFIVAGECVSKTTGELGQYEILDSADMSHVPILTKRQYNNLRSYIMQTSSDALDSVGDVRFTSESGRSDIERRRRKELDTGYVSGMLIEVGWTLKSADDVPFVKMAHPEKEHGVSATLDTENNGFFIFSTNSRAVAPFKPNTVYGYDRVERMLLNMKSNEYKEWLETTMGVTRDEIKQEADGEKSKKKIEACIQVAKSYGIKYNIISNNFELKNGEAVTDNITSKLWMEAMDVFKGYFSKRMFEDIVLSTEVSPLFDPILDYGRTVYREYKDVAVDQEQTSLIINAVHIDGAAEMAEAHVHAIRNLMRRWLIQIGRSVINSGGEAYELCLVLSGPQGCGKTTFLRALLPKSLRAYITGGPIAGGRFKDKDEIIRTAENILWIDDEWTTLKKSDQDHMKGVLSRTHISERGAYRRHKTLSKRRCVYAGTTNDSAALNDSTGNRRIIPVAVSHIDENVRGFEDDIINRELFLAEMIHMAVIQKGDWMLLDADEVEVLEMLTKEAQIRGQELEVIEEFYESTADDDEYRSLGIIMAELHDNYAYMNLNDYRVRKALDLMVNEGTITRSNRRTTLGRKGKNNATITALKYKLQLRAYDFTNTTENKNDGLPF